jgi:SAM-dependent methyltransferase
VESENDYDEFAAAYSEDNESNAWNALYERPASLALAGNVAGLRVLDAGCGAGAHAAALIAKGAQVTGIDKSPALVAIAKNRLGPHVRLEQADLNARLAFEDGSFELVIASLVMHYLQDWYPALTEFRRVLVPGGRVVMSTHHPFMDHVLAQGSNYFETYEFADQWKKGGRTIRTRYWHRPLHAMVDALTEAGFAIEAISEPQPLPQARDLFPEAYETLRTKPRFIFFAARTPKSAAALKT